MLGFNGIISFPLLELSLRQKILMWNMIEKVSLCVLNYL